MKLRGAFTVILASTLLTCACSTPRVAERYTPAAPPVVEVISPEPEGESTGVDLGEAPLDLGEVDWDSATLPSGLCGVERAITLTNGYAEESSSTWGPVGINLVEVSLGDFIADNGDEVALSVTCDNKGGTASGLLESAVVAFAALDGRLVVLGIVTPQKQFDYVLPTLLAFKEWRSPSLVVEEFYYRSLDSTCCPSGRAETEWTWTGSALKVAGTRVFE